MDPRDAANLICSISDGIRISLRMGLKTYPKGKKRRYNEMLDELARYLSTFSGKSLEASAVDQHVAWATTRQEDITSSGYAYQYLMNKAAAVEMGFTSSAELPGYMVTAP